MPPSAYPSITSVRPTKYFAPPADYKAITQEHIYEDQGASFNTTSDTAPQRWLINYENLTVTDAATLDAHFASARFTESFNFVDRAGATQSNVRYESYEADQGRHKKIQHRTVVLIKRPA